MQTPMIHKIFYINLDRRPEREEHMQNEFKKLTNNTTTTVSIERVPAV